MRERILKISLLLFLLIAWWLFCLTKIVNPLLLPSPITIFGSIISLGGDKSAWRDLLATLYRVLAGFFGGVSCGLLIGVCVGFSKRLILMLAPWIDFAKSVPPPALLPLFFLAFGIGDFSKIMLSVLVVALTTLVSFIYGLKNANPTRVLAGRSLNLNKVEQFFKVTLPEALPHLSAGLRISLSLSVVVIIVGEMLVSAPYGLGKRIVDYQMTYDTGKMYATILIIGLLGYALNQIYLYFETKHIHWAGK